MRGLVQSARHVLQQSFHKQLGYDALLLSPPADTARNVVDFSLHTSLHKVSWRCQAAGWPAAKLAVPTGHSDWYIPAKPCPAD